MRAKITTTIEEALLNKAKALAKQEGLSGANAIIERALELYFTSIQSEVWEKSLPSGWIKKLVLKGDSIKIGETDNVLLTYYKNSKRLYKLGGAR